MADAKLVIVVEDETAEPRPVSTPPVWSPPPVGYPSPIPTAASPVPAPTPPPQPPLPPPAGSLPSGSPAGGFGTTNRPTDLPPVPAGHVRFFHGGYPDTNNPTWVTPDQAYADGYASKNANGPGHPVYGSGGNVLYGDFPKDHPAVQNSWEKAGNFPEYKGLGVPDLGYASFEAPPDLAKLLKQFPGPDNRPTPDLGVFSSPEHEVNPADWNKPAGTLPTGDTAGGFDFTKAWGKETDLIEEAIKARTKAYDTLKDAEPAGRFPLGARDDGSPTQPPFDRAPQAGKLPANVAAGVFPLPVTGTPPPAGPDGTPPDVFPVSAFDRPQAVLVMGPNPLPVEVVKGTGEGAGGGSTKPKKDPNKWLGRLAAAGNFLTGAGNAGSAVVDNRVGDAFSTVSGGISKGLAMLGPEGAVAGAALSVFTKGIEASSEVVQAFVQRGKELSAYNGALAATTALSEVNSVQQDIHEADMTGDKIAELTTTAAEIGAIFREVFNYIKSWTLDIINPVLKEILDGMEFILKALDWLTRHTTPIGDILTELKEVKELLEGSGGREDLFDSFVKSAAALVPIPAAPRIGG